MKEKERLETEIVTVREQSKHYLYELKETLFHPEGGGQMPDRGTLNGEPVLYCREMDGHIYHATAYPLTLGQTVTVWLDTQHRYISRQGHTAQHLISAGFYDLYGIATISHHYDLSGSYIDLDTDQVDASMLERVEEWVNQKIAEHHPVEILYPDAVSLNQMPLHHTIKVKEQIRIVHIVDVEYNPCGGLHVENTAAVGMVVILAQELVRKKQRIHYQFGEVARNHLHQYYEQLKPISVALSKPLEQALEGFTQLQKHQKEQEVLISQLSHAYLSLYLEKLLQHQKQGYLVSRCDLEKPLLQQLLSALKETECYGFLVSPRQLTAFAGQNSGQDARLLFQKARELFNLRGGGSEQVCQGGIPPQQDVEKIEKRLKMWKES